MTLDDITRILEDRVLGRFYGKYPAVVTSNEDPLQVGRLRAKVPAILGEDVESGWALPCVPYGGGKDRGFLVLPEVGDTVWIEFVGGDVSRPVWTGAFWGSPESTGGQDDLGSASGTEVPTHEGTPAGPAFGVIRSKAGHRLVFDDDGNITIFAHGDDQAQVILKASGEVVVKAQKILLGESAAEPLVLGNTFMNLFNMHTHPTGVGPSGPPASPMTPSHLSAKHKTE